MHIESVTLKNFRCFGPEPQTLLLGPDVTPIIGANGSGKSNFIESLRRLFGTTRQERTLTRSDVHFGPEEGPDSVAEREIIIEALFAFPELDAADPIATQTIPEVFRVMTASGIGAPLKARLRLEALWKAGDGNIDEVETNLYWLTHLGEIGFGDEGGAGLDKQKLQSADRNKIQLVYMPATRDGRAVTQQALRQLLTRIERSGAFLEETKELIADYSQRIQTTVDDHDAIAWITERLTVHWTSLHDSQHLRSPRLNVLTQEFTQLLRSLTATLSPAPDHRACSVDELSEGYASLFFLALARTLAELESELGKGTPPAGFAELDTSPPTLTIYAVEEPENHLAPFYLSRLMNMLSDLCCGPKAMGIVTSHAPGVLRRVGPEAIRHLRLDRPTLSTRSRNITLPEDADEAAKYVRQAVLSQPEIYFAKLIVLGEGDSESIVIPRIAQALGVDLDPSFIAFAPLGGRHVNHFWRLLNDLSIPSLTILDFDLGRYGAGPLRLKYAYDQLVASGRIQPAADADLDTTAYWDGLDEAAILRWRDWLVNYGVFFSYPLDLDMMMMRAFPNAYGVNGFELPDNSEVVSKSVFGKGGTGIAAYANRAQDQDVPTLAELTAYDALFKKRGKPGSHLKALSTLDNASISADCPAPLRALIDHARRALGQPNLAGM